MHNKNEIIAGVGILVVIVIVILVIMGGSGKSSSQPSNTAESGTTTTNTMDQTSSTNGQSESQANTRTMSDGLQITDETVGTGTEAVAGDTVTVNYVGTFANGTKFDASADHGGPFSFTLGAGNVIKGWDEGVVGMKVGGARKLVVPPSLGYGSQDYGPIPGNSTLIFEVQLLGVKSAQ